MSLYVIKNDGFYAEYCNGGPVCYDYLQIVCCANVMYARRLMLPLFIGTSQNVQIHYDYTNKKAVVYK